MKQYLWPAESRIRSWRRTVTIAIAVGLLAAAHGASAQILSNGGFESGSLSGWTTSLTSGGAATFTVSTSPIHNGSKALHVNVTNAGTAANSVQVMHSSFAASSSNTYVLRFWATSNFNYASMPVIISGSTPSYPAIPFDISATPANPGSNSYQEYFYAFKASGNVSVGFTFKTVAAYDIDDVEILDVNNTSGWDVPLTYTWGGFGQQDYYNNVSHTGWTAADNDKSCLLPDGSVAWLFNDSWFAPLSFYTNIRGGSSFPRNSFVHQVGSNIYPVSNNTFFDTGDANHIYWIGDEVVDNGKLQALISYITINGGNLSRTGTSIATISLPGLTLDSITPIAAPGSDDYNQVVDGHDGFWYIYWQAKVARVPKGSLATSSAWTFWNGASWVADHTQAANLSGLQQPWSFETLSPGQFVAVYMPYLSSTITAQYAQSPLGPWSAPVSLYNTPGEVGELNYMPNVHKETVQNGVYTIGYSDNGYDLQKVAEDKSFYHPHFVRADFLNQSPYKSASYSEGFDMDAAGWRPYGGSWAVGYGQYFSSSGPGYKSIAGGFLGSDLKIEADITPGGGDAGLIFRGSNYSTGADSYNGYYAGLNTGGSVVLGKANGSWTQIASTPMTITSGTRYHIKIVAQGSSIKVYVTDMNTPKITATDTTYTSGSIGVRAFNSSAIFDNISAIPAASTQPIADGIYTLVPHNAGFSCLDSASSGVGNGNKAQVYGANNSGAQHWIFTCTGGSVYKVQAAYYPTLCLEVNGLGNVSGTNAQLWSSNDQQNQRWTVTAVAGGGYTLTPQSATALRLNAGGTADGSQINVTTASGATSQTWDLVAL